MKKMDIPCVILWTQKWGFDQSAERTSGQRQGADADCRLPFDCIKGANEIASVSQI